MATDNEATAILAELRATLDQLDMSDDGRTYYDVDEARAAAAQAEREGSMVCRICGLRITFGIADDARWAGSSTNPRAFLVHGECWDAMPPRARWAWPTDA